MSEEKTTTQIKSEKKDLSSRTKNRVGAFPRIAFSRTLELASTIFELGQGESVRRLRVFDYLKKSPDSGASRMLVTTSNMYGLTSGSYAAEYLSISEKGKKLMEATSEKEKLKITLDILFENEFFQKFVDHWKGKTRPSDDTAVEWFEKNDGFSKQDASSCWSTIKENLTASGLIKPYSGKDTVISREEALEAFPDNQNGLEDSSVAQPPETMNNVAVEERRNEFSTPKQNVMNTPKPYGSQIVERDFKYGRARLILPGDMTQDEIDKIKLLIDSMITVVND